MPNPQESSEFDHSAYQAETGYNRPGVEGSDRYESTPAASDNEQDVTGLDVEEGHRSSDESGYETKNPIKSKKAWVGGLAAGMVIFAAGFGIRGVGEQTNNEQPQQQEDDETEEIVDNTDLDINDSVVDEFNVSEALEEERPEEHQEDDTLSEPEEALTDANEQEATNEFEPVFMDANTPEELLAQLRHNMNCKFNAPSIEQKLNCVEHITGSSNPTDGSLTALYVTHAYDAYDYRQNIDANWIYKVNATLLDSTIPPNQDFSAAGLADRVSTKMLVHIISSDGSGEVDTIRKYNFIKTQATEITEHTDSLEKDVRLFDVWVLTGDQRVEPGSSVNIGS